MVSFENIQSSRLIHMKNAGKAVFTEENIQETCITIMHFISKPELSLRDDPSLSTFYGKKVRVI